MKREASYDILRASAIILVFVAHVLNKQLADQWGLLAVHALSPGLTMSVLGFLSALLVSKSTEHGAFLLRRATRIFIPLWLCLGVIVAVHAWQGRNDVSQQAIFHAMGLSAIFNIVSVDETTSLGAGLWFITVIVALYLVLPVLRDLFTHRNGFEHLGLVVVACAILDYLVPIQSTWNVVTAFAVGVFLVVNDFERNLRAVPLRWATMLTACVMVFVTLVTMNTSLYWMRSLLYWMYPLAILPLAVALARVLPNWCLTALSAFAAVSYEFYILHFYVINSEFVRLFGVQPLWLQLLVGFVVTLVAASIVAKVASQLRVWVERYLAEKPVLTIVSAKVRESRL